MRRLAPAVAVLAVLIAAGCSSSSSSSTRPKTATTTPATATPSPAAQHLSIRLDKAGNAASLPVSVDGHHYRFLIDTGATPTVIDTKVAKALHLATVGPPMTSKTVGCSPKSQLVRLTGLKVGTTMLPTVLANASTVNLPAPHGGHRRVVGLLGADALSNFHIVTIDYKHKRLILGGSAPTSEAIPFVPLRPDGDRAAELIIAPVRISGESLPLQVDTGADASLIATASAHRVHLPDAGKPVKVGAVSCSTMEQPIKIRHWSVGSHSLPTLTAVSGSSPSSSATMGQVHGLLGGDVLRREGRVTFDFARNQLFLGH